MSWISARAVRERRSSSSLLYSHRNTEMTLEAGTYTWEFGDSSQALWFVVSYDTETNQWTVEMKRGSMDLNAFWWSNDDTNKDGDINLISKDNSLNMNGTGVVWDGYDKVSDTGLTGTEHDGSSLLTTNPDRSPKIYTYDLSKDGGQDFEALLANANTSTGEGATLGIRATSVNGSSGIKAVNGEFTFVSANTPPTARDDTGTAVEAGVNPGSNATGNVLTDSPADSDPDGDPLTVSAIRTGTEVGTGTAGTIGSPLEGMYGSLTLNADGTYTYVVDNANETVNALNGTGTQSLAETFTYTVSDGKGGTDTAELVITINGANDAPTLAAIADGSVADAFDSPALGIVANLSGTLNGDDVDNGAVLAYGIDGGTATGPGDPDGFDVKKAGTYGTLYLNSTTGAYEFVPDAAAVNALAAGAEETDVFTLSVTDEFGAQATETFTVNLTGANDSPEADPENFISTQNTTAVFSGDFLLNGDVDVDGDPIEIFVPSGSTVTWTLVKTDDSDFTGTVVYNKDTNSFSFTTGGIGTYTFEYTITDGELTATGTATIDVRPATGAANPISFTGAEYDASFIDAKGGGDTINAGNSPNELYGGTGNDVIVGGAGFDLIVGGAGADNMTGGLGADIFRTGAVGDSIAPVLTVMEMGDTITVSTTTNPLAAGNTLDFRGGVDIITDFSSVEGDKIDVAAAGVAPTSLIGLNPTTALAASTTYVVYGSWDDTTQKFTLATEWDSTTNNDALIAVGNGSLSATTTTAYTLLKDVEGPLVGTDFI
ncbi:VCBS domain-containing protein [Cyanobium sp. CH-040]|uniref:VCBS domain-containing protein n=1 Tax=Cyanobium sp. CH-040 TaxID=2823708 RepID=UPI0020CDDC24|nr:VCBS domain-containing protein [Cyanobium sp. CH-040]MCP9928210.1 VCBS domain-containing protein [Cyanobium sp. CH-040]